MTRVLLILADLHPNALARQAFLLARHLPADGLELCVAVLGSSTPWVEALREQGRRVETLGWQRPFDVAPFLGLRRLLRTFRPSVIHAWGPLALRGLTLAGGPGRARLLLSGQLPPAHRPGTFDRWLWPRSALFIAQGQAEAHACEHQGVAARQIAIVQPGVEPWHPTAPAALPGLPDSAPVVLSVGPFLPHKGQREAVWSLDILHYLFPNLHLILVGDGPERQETQRFASLIGVTAECHFVGSVLDTGPYYQRADLVWITGRGEGINTMLEAMAAGKAIVAARHPLRADVLVDGKTGLFAAPGDKADLCRLTRMLLDQPERRLELGQAAQQHAAEKFAVPRFVAQTMALYQGVSLVG